MRKREPGTAVEAAYAVKMKRPLILLAPDKEAEAYFRTAKVAGTAEEAIGLARDVVESSTR